jgi:Fe2+ or Zn2+ uptake regulation protein
MILNMTADEFIEILKNKKQRITPGRRKIINIVCKSDYPLSAETIIKKVGMNKTSIYREFEFLLKQGFIQEVDFGDGTKRYELKDLKHHHHLICLRCKKVRDISFNENLEWEESNIKKNQKFQVLRHDLEFFGYCRNCQ